MRPLSFTLKHDDLKRVLVSEIAVFPAFDPADTPSPPKGNGCLAIWDTGATNTSISKQIVQALDLKQVGVAQVQIGNGRIEDFPRYFVNIQLPNTFGIVNLMVTGFESLTGADALIGMDIITTGDFAVTNKDGKTTFSFRCPSIDCIDFEKNQPIATSLAISRNAPCPCGSGKKYKRCCGSKQHHTMENKI